MCLGMHKNFYGNYLRKSQNIHPSQQTCYTVLYNDSSIQNYLADNIQAASQQVVRRDPQKERLTEVEKKQEKDLARHQRGRLPK